MARINSDKFRSLRRLYGGLRVLTLLAGGLLAVLALSMLASRQPPADAVTARLLSPRANAPLAAAPADVAAGLSAPSRSPPPGCARPPASRGTEHSSASSRSATAARSPRSIRATRPEASPRQGQPRGRGRPTPSGRLVLLAEKKGDLVVWDPGSASEVARFPIDTVAVLGKEPADRNQGFEGLAFREDTGSRAAAPSTWCTRESRAPRGAQLRSRGTGAHDRSRGRGRAACAEPYEDLTAVAWCEALGRLLVIAESDDRLLLVSPAGTVTEGAGRFPEAARRAWPSIPRARCGSPTTARVSSRSPARSRH